MKNTSFLLALSFLSFNAFAVIFGHDKRLEAQLEAPEFEKNLARSVPALILKSKLEKQANGDYRIIGKTLQKEFGFCEDANFSDQKRIANCSASYIGDQKILTAAHCLSPETKMGCEDYVYVFDYAKKEFPLDSEIIPKENVYECAEVLYEKFDKAIIKEDIAIIKLTKEVVGRKKIEVDTRKKLKINDELFMIGYPLGIYQKLVTSGNVTDVKPENVSFSHNLDSFSVNSGGPIFDKNSGKQVGVLVRGTGSNWSEKEKRYCNDWTYAKEGDFSDGNSLRHMRGKL